MTKKTPNLPIFSPIFEYRYIFNYYTFMEVGSQVGTYIIITLLINTLYIPNIEVLI